MSVKIKNVRDAWTAFEIDKDNFIETMEYLLYLTYLKHRKEVDGNEYEGKNQSSECETAQG